MGTWHDAHWESTVVSGVPARDRRSGPYRWYEPDRLEDMPLHLAPETATLLAQAERAVRNLSEGPVGEDLAGLARFLLRSEAIASSRIEGIASSAKQVALAELADNESVAGFSAQAELVARNMTVVHKAATALAEAERITVDGIVDLHRALLADEPRHHGLRTRQNWIGSFNQPIDADFVPPAPEHVPSLMGDLVEYMNGAGHSALVQAALVHAQFETIHPFTDGNGRVGRALIHTVLMRRGLTRASVLPISLVLATFRNEYVAGLMAFRHEGSAGVAIDAWLDVFVNAVEDATAQALRLGAEVAELRAEWQERLDRHREDRGRKRAMRSDSATAAVLADLPGTPVLTTATVARIHAVSKQAAVKALSELAEAGILDTRSAGRGVTAYVASEVLDLVTLAERRLARTRYDTRVSSPVREVPAAPVR